MDYFSFLNEISNLYYPTALAGLLLLLPLILLYFLKPKPRHILFPTIMFIKRMEKEKRFQSLLNRFIRDPLLFMQLIILSLLVLSVAGPFVSDYVERTPVEDVVLVIDSSASMQSTDVGPTRFAAALSSASEVLDSMHDDSRASIVFAGKNPIQAAYNVDREEAGSALWAIDCGDSQANLADALAYSYALLSESPRAKRVIVFSDFSGISSKKIELHRKLALNRNITVDLFRVSSGGDNMGFIHGAVERITALDNRAHLTLNVKNFKEMQSDGRVEVFFDGEKIKDVDLSLDAGSDRLLEWELSSSADAHYIEVNLAPTDDLMLDNKALFYLPPMDRYRILLVTNDSADNFLSYAISASPNLEVREAVFPIIPDFYGFNTVVIGDFSREMSLPGTFEELEMYVRGGGNLVVVASDSIVDEDIKKLIPVDLIGQNTGNKNIDVLLNHKILNDVVLSNLVVNRFYATSARNDSIVISSIAGYPALSYWGVGGGKVFFLGVNPSPSWSNFYLSSSLPIFCYQLFNWINFDDSALATHSFKSTDYFVSTGNVSIILPSGLVSGSRNLLLDEVGVYKVNVSGRSDVFTVNLFDEFESDISNSSELVYSAGLGGGVVLTETRRDFVGFLVILLLFLVFLEMFLYRWRGKL